MKHLHELEIREFRNVEKTKLEFRRGINIVLGKNASGKTTLLRLLEGAFSGKWIQSEPLRADAKIDCDGQILTRSPEFVMQLSSFGLIAQNHVLVREERLRFERTGEKAFSGRLREGWSEVDGFGTVRGDGLLPLVNQLHRDNPTLAKSLFAAASAFVRRLDEGLDYLEDLRSLVVTRRNTEIEVEPEILIPQSLVSFLSKPTPETVSTSGETTRPAFANRCAKLMGYDAAVVRFELELKTNGAWPETTYREPSFQFERGKDRISDASLSYGEKRLLSLFAMSDACPEVMIVDELVNGLHHEWIRACIEEIGQRQSFLTSQNPLLLDYLEFASPEDVRTGFVLCERVGNVLRWRNPTLEEAREFFEAYETGIQRVSDILITKGFW